MAKFDSKPPKYTDWHKIGLKLLLSGDKPTAQGLIDGRGGGSMTTATAALNEFYADYLPSVLSAATLGAPGEIADLVGDLWTRLASYARDAATTAFDHDRGELQAQVKRLEADLAKAAVLHQEQAREIETAKAAAAQHETRAIGAEGELSEQKRIVEGLNRALSQAQRDMDRQSGELAQARTAATDRKAELATLREEHRTGLTTLRTQHREELARLRESHKDALQALRDRIKTSAAEHALATESHEAAAQELRRQIAVAHEASTEREQSLQQDLASAREALAIARGQLDQSAHTDAEHRAERDRLAGLVNTLQATIRSLSPSEHATPPRTKKTKRKAET